MPLHLACISTFTMQLWAGPKVLLELGLHPTQHGSEPAPSTVNDAWPGTLGGVYRLHQEIVGIGLPFVGPSPLIDRDVAEVRILTIRFTGWATGRGLKDEGTPPAIRLTLVLLNLRAEISVIDERLPTLRMRCSNRSPQLKVDVPVDVSGQHDIDAWSGGSFEGRFSESQTKVKELADVVVHGSVMDVEAARPTSSQQDRASLGVQ